MIAFSFHQHCLGKPEKRMIDHKTTHWIGDKRINLGYDWITTQAEFADIFELLTVDGCAFAPALLSNHRDELNFLSHQIAMVDIDSGMTLTELQQHAFYQQYGSGYYTTASHTDQDPRFRILYRLPVPVTDAYTMRVIYEGLLAVHGAADIACKDAARLFFGTQNAQHREIRECELDTLALQQIVQARDAVIATRQIAPPRATVFTQAPQPRTPEQVQSLLDELRKYYSDLDYATRRDVTWAVASAVDSTTTIRIMRERWSDTDKTGKYEQFVADLKRNSLSLGTIYHMIRKHDATYGVRPQAMSMDQLREKLKQGKI